LIDLLINISLLTFLALLAVAISTDDESKS